MVRLTFRIKKHLVQFFGRWPGGAEEARRMGRALAEKRKRVSMRKVRFQ